MLVDRTFVLQILKRLMGLFLTANDVGITVLKAYLSSTSRERSKNLLTGDPRNRLLIILIEILPGSGRPARSRA